MRRIDAGFLPHASETRLVFSAAEGEKEEAVAQKK